MGVFFGLLKDWSTSQVIWGWLFMIGLNGTAIIPMMLPRKHGATTLAKVTLLSGDCMAVAALLYIVSVIAFEPGAGVDGLAGAAVGVGIVAVILAHRNRNSSTPPAYKRRF